MRRILFIALGTAVALATAAVAVAVVPSASGVSATTADFAAGTVAQSATRTCTGADARKYEVTEGRYTGTMTSTSNPVNLILSGPLTIHARTTYDTTNSAAKLGYVEGTFRVKDDDSRVSGRFWGTLSNGNLVGFLEGRARGHHAVVLGNMSAGFDPAGTTGFTAGKLGLGSSTTMLAVIAGPRCHGEKDESRPEPKPDKPVRPASVRGEVTALSDKEIVVTSKGPTTTKCAIGTGSPATAGLLNKQVEMKCEYLGAAPNQIWTLTRIELHR